MRDISDILSISVQEVMIDGGTKSGKVQVLNSGKWGGICSKTFGANEANVFCRQIGYQTGTAHDWLDEKLHVSMDKTYCRGYEPRITDCGPVCNYCYRCVSDGQAGVVCTETEG